jgi:omega-6 fatty acid desaturase (delta-12 desaturase)
MCQGQAPPKRQPTATPPFTIGTLRKAIPPHCFERSLLRSSAYLGADLAAVAFLYFCSTLFSHPAVPALVRWGLLWPAYWVLQGAVCTGLWVIAHECGHQAFSKYQTVNDAVGLVVHTCLLVPYYSWKHSHRRHHSNTGSLAKDEVFVPPKKAEHPPDFTVHDYALGRFAYIFVTLTMGWPTYLFFNVTGRPYKSRWVNHFDPYSEIFSKRERVEVFISDLALVVFGGILWRAAQAYGWAWLTCVYIIPYLVVNHWLVMITLLQHTHRSLPHYEDKEWDWLRGALATVDRSYGIFNYFHHHIADTHVAHHLFSQMPHYHAEEATRAIKPVLGDYYMWDSREVYTALWENWQHTRVVQEQDKDSGIYWYAKVTGK